MKFRKKISFSVIVLEILSGSLVRSFPKTFSSNSYITGKKLPFVLSSDNLPVTAQSFNYDINEDTGNIFQEPDYKAFCTPENDYPLISKSKLKLKDKSKPPFHCKSFSKYLPKYDYLNGLKTTSSKTEISLPPEFSSTPNYRDLANFPEVEYPMTVTEIWKPNYWNSQPTDYSCKNINTNNNCINPTLNDLIPIQNFGTILQPETQTTYLTKSYSDPIKNIISLRKANECNHNILKNGNQKEKENKTISLNSSNIDNLNKIANPISITICSAENKSKNNFNDDVCPIDTRSLDRSAKFLKSDVASNLTSQSKILVSTYAEKFKDEIKSILKTIADDIILNNIENAMIPAQLTEHTEILDTITGCNELNIYNEFISPDILKNRRSQGFDEFTKYGTDFFIPDINIQSKSMPTDLSINTYADKFNDDMTSALKSKVDNFFLNTFENSKNEAILKTNINHNDLIKEVDYYKQKPLNGQYIEHLRKDSSKMNYEPQLPLTDEVISTHADKLHDEMTRKMAAKADDILLKPFEISYNQPIGAQKVTNNNNKLDNMAKVDYKHSTKDDTRKPEYKDTKIKSDILYTNKIPTTRAPELSNFSSNTNNLIANVKQEFHKVSDNKSNNQTPTSVHSLPSNDRCSNNTTCKNEASVSYNSGENIINNMDKGMFLPVSDKEESKVLKSDSMEKDIEVDEDFTTDSYPENESDWSSYALSTVAPRTSTVDILWRDSRVIEPDKSLAYPDELEQYFLMD